MSIARPSSSFRSASARAGSARAGASRATAVAAVAVVVVLTVDSALGSSPPALLRVVGVVGCVVAVAGLIEVVLMRPFRSTITDVVTTSAQLRRSATDAEQRLSLIHQLDHSLRAADNDAEALAALGRAVSSAFDDHDAEILLCAAGESGVSWRISVGASGLAAPTTVARRPRCHALVLSRITQSTSPGQVDRCPHIDADDVDVDGATRRVGTIDDDTEAAGSTCCAPITVDGDALGVVFLTGAVGDTIEPHRIELLDTLTRQTGDRIALLRGRRARQTTAQLDPLTGLAGAEVARQRLDDLAASQTPYAIAIGDVDQLGAINERDGERTGDRILAAYGEVLRRTLRPDDVAARIAGDRFLVVLAACDAPLARAAVERVREQFALELASSALPPASVSVGIADSTGQRDHAALLDAADTALLDAKADGGNRATLAGEFD